MLIFGNKTDAKSTCKYYLSQNKLFLPASNARCNWRHIYFLLVGTKIGVTCEARVGGGMCVACLHAATILIKKN